MGSGFCGSAGDIENIAFQGALTNPPFFPLSSELARHLAPDPDLMELNQADV